MGNIILAIANAVVSGAQVAQTSKCLLTNVRERVKVVRKNYQPKRYRDMPEGRSALAVFRESREGGYKQGKIRRKSGGVTEDAVAHHKGRGAALRFGGEPIYQYRAPPKRGPPPPLLGPYTGQRLVIGFGVIKDEPRSHFVAHV